MSKTLTAGDFMTTEVVVANTKNTFNQIMQFFSRYGIHHIPVLEKDEIIGIISVNDLLQVLYNQLSGGNSVSFEHMDSAFDIKSVMTPDPIVISPDTTLEQVLQYLSADETDALPVVQHGKIIGIITYKDLIQVFNDEKNHPGTGFTIETPGFGI